MKVQKTSSITIAFYALIAFLFLSACLTTDETNHVLNMRIDKDNDSLLHFDSMTVTVYNKDSSFSQVVFHGILRAPSQVMGMPLDPLVGKEYTVSIIGYKNGKVGVNKLVSFLEDQSFLSKDLPIQPLVQSDTIRIDPKIPAIVVHDTALLEGDSVRLLVSIRNPSATATLSLKDAPSGAFLDTLNLGSSGIGYFTWRPGFIQGRLESYLISLVYGSGALKIEKTFNVKVHNVNRVPKLARLSNLAKNEMELLEFNVTATDLDGDFLTFTADSLPANAIFSNGLFSWSPGASAVGNYVLTFRVTDGFSSDSQTVILSIGAVNRPPEILGLSDTTLKEYDSIGLEVTTKDPEGKLVDLKASGLPDSANFIQTTLDKGRLVWKVKGNQSRIEPYLISFSASDGEHVVKATLRITVLDVPRKIVVAITSPATDAITNQKTIQVQWKVNDILQKATLDTLKQEGANLITRAYNDGEGNTGSHVITVYRDTLAPAKPSLSVPTYAKALPVFTWSQVEAGISYHYRLVRTGIAIPIAKGATTGLVFPAEGSVAPTVTSGEYWFYIQAIDRAGNASAETGHRILIDLINPSLLVTGPTEMGRTCSINPTITGVATDNQGIKSISYSIQDGAPKPLGLDNGKWSLAGLALADGPNKLVFTVKDSADRDSTIIIIINKESKVVFVREGATGNGTSWEDALPDLDIALNPVYVGKYVGGTQIWATAGNYPRGTDYSLYMKSDLTFIGGFSKSRPQASPSARDTADGRSYFFTRGAVTDLFNVAEYNQATTLQTPIKNVTFDGFDFMSTDANGILISGGSNILFKNCGFKDAPNGMVIVKIDTSFVEFQDCSFSGNKSSSPVVIENKSQSVSFNNCLFQDNSSNGAGAIKILAGNVLVQNSSFKNNTIATWVMDEQVKSLRHIMVTWPGATLSMKNCKIQGLKSDLSSITTDSGSPFAVDPSNKEWN